MSENQLIRGTMILTLAILISRVLGLIYVFPFQAIVGHTGMALYGYGYVPYTIILSIATMGVPLAVSKFVSKYNALGDYETGHRLLKSGLIFMTMTGIFAFVSLFALAHPIAVRAVGENELQGNTIADVVFVIRMVSVALIVVPVMAVIRGFFQGHQSMGPTAVSQVIEQLVRIIFILILTFFIIHVWGGSLATAVGFATFGAFIGALGGLAVLLLYWKKRKPQLDKLRRESSVRHKISLKEIYKELFKYAIPLSLVGLAIPLYQLVDLLTFNPAMRALGYTKDVYETYYASFTQTSHKLIMIPVSIATAMSLTILPTVTDAFINKDTGRLNRTITQTFQIILFLSIPAAVGMMIVSDPLYRTLFSGDGVEIGAIVLRDYAWVAVVFSIFTVSAALLQGINQQKYAILALFSGFLFKAAFNSLFVSWFEVSGAIAATGIGYLIAIAINVWAIRRFAQFDFTFIIRRLILISLFTGIMAIVVLFFTQSLGSLLSLENITHRILLLIVSVGSGIIVYLNISIRTGLAGQILGSRFSFLKK